MKFIERRMTLMGRAKTFEDLFDALTLNSEDGDIGDFYVDTAVARGTDAAARVEYILKTGSRGNKKFLFAGHSGSGKSTELIRLAEKIKGEYMVAYLSIADYVNFTNVSFGDIVFAMLKGLVDSAEENKIFVDRGCLEDIMSYWRDENVITKTEEENYQFEASGGVEVSLYKLISMKIKGLFQQGTTIKNETVSKVERSMSQFVSLINNFIYNYKQKLNGKDLLIIVDDMDKLGENDAMDVFKEHYVILTSINANIIYTFPVFMHYNPYYRYISMNFDESVILSIIMTKTINGQIYEPGIIALREIINKRAEAHLFEEKCIDFAIEKSGGSIRNLLRFLSSATVSAGLRYDQLADDVAANTSKIVTIADVENAYREYKNDMKRSINKSHLSLLKEVYKSKSTINEEDNDLVMDMFRVLAIIEYNCDRWCDLNPALLDYLTEIHEIEA